MAKTNLSSESAIQRCNHDRLAFVGHFIAEWGEVREELALVNAHAAE